MQNEYRPRFDVPVISDGIFAFCGPTVLSILTGKDVRQIEREIAARRLSRGENVRTRRKAVVAGMYCHEITDYLESNGFVPVEVTPAYEKKQKLNRYYGVRETVIRRPTIFQWLNRTAETRGNDVYLIATASHVLLISGDEMRDTSTRGLPVSISRMKYKKARIDRVWCILRDAA